MSDVGQIPSDNRSSIWRWIRPNDWRSRITESDLTPPLQSMLLQLIRDSKLTRGERICVVNELVAHFEDGRESGRSWTSLEDEFGDPRQVALLIQRSKERNRPMWSKVLKSAGVVSIVGAVIVFLWGYSFLNRKATPSVDYTAELNRRALASAEAERAWPDYRETWIKYKFVQMSLYQWVQDRSEDDATTTEFTSINTDHSLWPQVEDFLSEHADLIDALRVGSRKPALGLELKNFIDEYSAEDQAALFPSYVASQAASGNDEKPERTESDRLENSFVISVLLPHVQAFRTAGELMQADARLAMTQKDVDRAIDDIRAQFAMAKHATECSCFVGALVGYSVVDNGYATLYELINHPEIQLTDVQRDKLDELVASIDVRSFIEPKSERLMIYDLLQRTYTDDGKGRGRITKQGLAAMSGLFTGVEGKKFGYAETWKFLNSDRMEIREAFDTFYDSFEADLVTPWHKQPRSVDELASESLEPGSPASYFVKSLYTGLGSIRDVYHRSLAKQNAVKVVLAMHRYRAKAGRFPPSLEDLTPDYLSDLPSDPLSNRPISVALDGERNPTLYFWGHDGVDNGGAMLDGGPNHQVRNAFGDSAKGYKGDWIVWPPAK